jgi:hypothetical protein
MDWLRGVHFWPLTSPDLPYLDLFPVGFVKDEVYIMPVPITVNNCKD